MKDRNREFPGSKTGNVAAYLGMQPGEFFSRLVELGACPPNVSMSEAAWNLLLQPLYQKTGTLPAGNGKLAEILYEAAVALKTAQRNGAEFDVSKAEGRNAKIALEVHVGGSDTPMMEIGIAGERELKSHPEKLEQTDTPPVYFLLHTLGKRT